MSALEYLKLFLEVPEIATVGSSEERAAFIGLRLHGRTVREVGQAIGVSKSNVANLADIFQAKLRTRVREIQKRRAPKPSAEYRRLHDELSGFMDWDYGDFDSHEMSREDRAEAFGGSLHFDDE